MQRSSIFSRATTEQRYGKSNLVSANYYVNYRYDNVAHYKDNSENTGFSQAPYFWTNDLSYCVGIGLIYTADAKKDLNGSVAKIGLYHSVSEHLDLTIYFKNSLLSFLKNINDTNHIEVIMSFNPFVHSEKSMKNDAGWIIENINNCCKELKKAPIPNDDNHCKKFIGGPTFFVATDGTYGTFHQGSEKALIEIKKLIDCYISSSNIFNPFPAGCKEIQKISTPNSLKAIEACKQIANDHLLKNRLLNAKAIILYLKIIAWDIILNAPSKDLLENWLRDNNYSTNERILGQVINIRSIAREDNNNDSNNNNCNQTTVKKSA